MGGENIFTALYNRLLFEVEIQNILGVTAKYRTQDYDILKGAIIPRSNITWMRKFSNNSLEENYKLIAAGLGDDMAWSFGIKDLEESYFFEHLNKNYPDASN